MKFKNWDGEDLIGLWMITIKIDGIQAKKEHDPISRVYYTTKNGQILNNMPAKIFPGDVFEVFNGNCNDTWSILSGPEGERKRITSKQVYKLYPEIDKRLILVGKCSPTAALINHWFNTVREEGHEGLVLRRLDKDAPFIKVKANYTVDTKIIGWVEGKGRLKGKLGKFITEHGGVGGGLTDAQREEFWKRKKQLLHTTIEVKCMELTKNNKFRHPRFVKLRPDK